VGDVEERGELTSERREVSNGRICYIKRCIPRVQNSAVDTFVSAGDSVDPSAPMLESTLPVTLQSNLLIYSFLEPKNTTK
jgi:hypothetical protein